ncbi:hypothetical protein [Permianibacter aggregans]|uniref:Uracil DNA glycosylase superfamily protein n=1 Tax=Permianibacter aggregans TaxID=1510150 RepID=A0A4R6UDP5_9GAMM|nr:hypothetical protein [Permianibacter aggregans]QGX39697.1 hypothetical protein E2H98_08525 [Permianibacter aggregans]TDQ43229.1 uracil DNA glycosylase superfamily protein [Permianibacter aggregans]
MKDFIEQIPQSLFARSGKVFYSGRNAFATRSDLYVLGVNPGGAPKSHEDETIGSHTNDVLNLYPADWSAYRDESWEGAAPGTYGMAPRVLHLFAKLGVNPGTVPCSNLIFVRSRRENDLKSEMSNLIEMCWSFHEFAIAKLQPKAVLCFGKTAGTIVRKKLGAHEPNGDDFVEKNNRRWRSQAFENTQGIIVVVATHPSIADWTAPNTDPTHWISKLLGRNAVS